MDKTVTIEFTLDELKEVKKSVQEAIGDIEDCGYWIREPLNSAYAKIKLLYDEVKDML